MSRLNRWVPHTMFVGSGALALAIAMSVSSRSIRLAHAQFDGDPSAPSNAAPSPPPIIGQPPQVPPPQASPSQAAPQAAPPASSPLVGNNPLPPPPPPPPPPAATAPAESSPLVGNNPLPPPSAAPNQLQQIPPPPQMNAAQPAAQGPPQSPPALPMRPAATQQMPTPPPMNAMQPPPMNEPPPANDKPLNEMTFLEPYVFDMREGRRNPFRPYIQMDATSAANAAASLPGTPLERYELEEIKLVGIMWQIKTPKAMFIDPQGEVHVLTKDDRIGRHHGYIAAIRENEVVIIEPGSVVGESAYSTRILQLDRDQKDKR